MTNINFIVHQVSENCKAYPLISDKPYRDKKIVSVILPTIYNVDNEQITINDVDYTIKDGLYTDVDDFISAMNDLSSEYVWSVDKIRLKIKVESTTNITIIASKFTRYFLGFSDTQLDTSSTSIEGYYTYNLFPCVQIGIVGDRLQNNITVGVDTYSALLDVSVINNHYSYNINEYTKMDYFHNNQRSCASRSSDSHYQYRFYMIYPDNSHKLLKLHGQTVRLLIKRTLTT